MSATKLVIATSAIVLMAAALAARNVPQEGAEALEALKSSLKSDHGFEVDSVRTTDAGVACIFYHVPNDAGGVIRAQAVVDGDKVVRSTSGKKKFATAWNSKCAGSHSDGK